MICRSPQSFGPPPRMLNLPVRLVLLKYVGQGASIFSKKKQGKRSLGVFCLGSFIFGRLDFCCQRVPKKTTQMVYHLRSADKFPKSHPFLNRVGGNLVSPQQISRQSFQYQSTRPALGPLLCGSRASLTQRDAWLDWTEGPTPKTPKKYKKREQKRKLYQRFI